MGQDERGGEATIYSVFPLEPGMVLATCHWLNSSNSYNNFRGKTSYSRFTDDKTKK